MKVRIERGELDLDAGKLGDVQLSPIETRLVAFLAAHPDEVFDRGALLREVWGYPDGVASRTVFATVERVRRKIERDPRLPRHLVTLGRAGYAWRPLGQPVAPSSRTSSPPRAPLAPADTFVGRGALLDELRAMVTPDGVGLVTLYGPAGVGKTRLALAVADAVGEAMPGGVVFAELAGATGVADVVGAVGAALDLPLGSSAPERHAARIARVLGARGPSLVVLDGADPVRPEVAALAQRWQAATVLVTTRRPLDAPGERSVAVPPLPLDDAAALFLARTRERRRGYTPTDADRDVIARTAAALDGLPLALELAARWTGVLDPDELLRRIEAQRLPLTDPERGERHGSLVAAIAWTWGDLPAPLRRALAVCAVFVGSFDAEAAEAVLGGASGRDLAPLDAIEALVRALA